MTSSALRGAAALAAVAALAAGCGGDGPAAAERGGGDIAGRDASATRSPAGTTTPPQTGPAYKLSGSLCAKADQKAITEVYPKQDGPPMVDTEKLCVVTWQTDTRSFTLTIDADVTPEEQAAKDWVDGNRELRKYPTTEVTGVGTAAFWQEIMAGEVRLTSYHGNLVLRVEGTVTDRYGFPKDIQARLIRVATGTYQRLAP